MSEKGQNNRQRIVAAADMLFYQQGFNATTFAQVAEISGVPKGNFYYYFRSKDELLQAVIEHRLELIRSHLDAWEREYAAPRDRLKRLAHILHNEAENIASWGCPMGSLNAELGKADARLQQQAARMFDLYIEWAERQLRALGKGDESLALALHLLAMAQGAATLGHVYGNTAILSAEEGQIGHWIDGL